MCKKHRLDDSEASPENEPRSVDSVILELEEQRAWLDAELDEQQTWIQECDVRLPTAFDVAAGGSDAQRCFTFSNILGYLESPSWSLRCCRSRFVVQKIVALLCRGQGARCCCIQGKGHGDVVEAVFVARGRNEGWSSLFTTKML